METTEKIPLGISTAIVKTLKRYDKKIPTDFLARLVGRRTSEIKEHLESLQQKGIIELDHDNVSISIKSEK